MDFSQLEDHLRQEVENLQTCILWRNCVKDDSCLAELEVISKNVDQMCLMMNELKLEMAEERTKLAHLNKRNDLYKKMEERLTYLVHHVPDRLPKHQREITAVEVSSVREAPDPVTKSEVTQEKSQEKSQEKKPSLGKQLNVYVPQIEYLTVEEFQQIPKYQKGRLTYDQINKFVDGFNLAFKSKYQIMKMKKSRMKGPDRRRYDIYVSQENKDTAGCYFVIDQDLQDYGAMKLDKIARTMVALLRHCGRLKEVRGGNLTRYKYVDSY